MTRACRFPIRWALAAALAGLAVGPALAENGPGRPVCFGAGETREVVKARRLLEPFVALKNAQVAVKAEPLAARLCRLGDEFFYEITLLHRDGRLVHVSVNAVSGKVVVGRAPREAAPRT